MCLARIVIKKRPVKEGYKLYRRIGNELFGEYIHTTKAKPKRRWLREKDYRSVRSEEVLRDGRFMPYPTGWHLYHNLKDAKSYLKRKRSWYPHHHYEIWKVKVKEPCCAGIQTYNRNVTVCKQIYIYKRMA